MRITTQGDYALRCVLNIAAKDGSQPVCIGVIADEEKLPVDYIEQLLSKLRRKGLVKSLRGVKGGYILARDPSKITVKDVLEAVEGEAFEMICERFRNLKKKCKSASTDCVLRVVWMGLKKRIDEYLEAETIGSLLARAGTGSA